MPSHRQHPGQHNEWGEVSASSSKGPYQQVAHHRQQVHSTSSRDAYLDNPSLPPPSQPINYSSFAPSMPPAMRATTTSAANKSSNYSESSSFQNRSTTASSRDERSTSSRDHRKPSSRNQHYLQQQQQQYYPDSPPRSPTSAQYSNLETERRPKLSTGQSQQSSHHHNNSAESSVLGRMQKGGWIGVDNSRASPEEFVEGKPGSIDSGYGTDSGVVVTDPEGQGYMGGWNKLKKAVWGEDDGVASMHSSPSATSLNGAGSRMWDSMMIASTVVSSTFSDALARSRGDDDLTVGADGDTKLTRTMKEFHVQKAQKSSDLPSWLFTREELAARQARSEPPRSTRDSESRQSSDFTTPAHSSRRQQAPSSNPDRRQRTDDTYDGRDSNRAGRRSDERVRERDSNRHGIERVEEQISGSGSRATDKLRAMSAAKRGVR